MANAAVEEDIETNTNCSPTQQAIIDVPHRLFAAWDRGDAAGVAAQFTTDGHMIPSNGAYLTSRQAIAAYYQKAFAGPLKDTRMIGEPLSVRCLSNSTAVIDGLGGMLMPGDTYTDPEQVPIGQRIIVSWTAVRINGVYYMKEFQSTLVQG
ncbi:SgcJ/EcaC family oxidoreductase [Streptomyces nanhaiensis]|uniref:SgcJ/EcaC family oxidoreductase n=1 Tax=Streptomyces nanhaiensis TaxID=679319 RepID=UPI00399CD69C